MLYLVSRTDSGRRWDEYNAVIINAKSIQAAYDLATSLADEYTDADLECGFGMRFPGFKRDGSNLTIQRVNPKSHGDPTIVLASYNAG